MTILADWQLNLDWAHRAMMAQGSLAGDFNIVVADFCLLVPCVRLLHALWPSPQEGRAPHLFGPRHIPSLVSRCGLAAIHAGSDGLL